MDRRIKIDIFCTGDTSVVTVCLYDSVWIRTQTVFLWLSYAPPLNPAASWFRLTCRASEQYCVHPDHSEQRETLTELSRFIIKQYKTRPCGPLGGVTQWQEHGMVNDSQEIPQHSNAHVSCVCQSPCSPMQAQSPPNSLLIHANVS